MCSHPRFVSALKSPPLLAVICTAIAFWGAIAVSPALSAEAENTALDSAFEALCKLELGQDLAPFRPIREAVAAARNDDKVRADIESRLVAVLQSDATDLAKDYACRELAVVGTDASVSALAALQSMPRNAYMARYALEGIASPRARQSLREMLAKVETPQKMGIVISLGRLADTEAVSLLAPLLDQEDDGLRKATLVALGRMGSGAAADVLQAFAAKAPEPLRLTLVDAQLEAAETLCRRGEHAAAATVCQSLLNADAERVRAAALRCLIAAKPAESLDMILTALSAEESWKRAVAADCVVALDKPDQIRAIAAAVDRLPAAGKIAALHGLKDRRDAAVREAALHALADPNIEVRTTALAALVASATPTDVPSLASMVATAEHPQLRNAAFETLRLMPAAGANEALSAWMIQQPELSSEVVRCALARRSPAFVPAFLQAAESSAAATRKEAFKALEIMSTAKDAPALVALLSKTPPGEEREAADRAVWMSCQQIADPAERSAPLLAALENAGPDVQSTLLPTLARIGGVQALARVHQAMKSGDPAVRDAGYRALANWPDASVADEL
ncbi:MAG: HEAT repeat domain-containing protein, partial [Thermoguttaceae bacterium]|nr:HEAT repeat domain-containing protein [Thermoguttaceae bacterium]